MPLGAVAHPTPIPINAKTTVLITIYYPRFPIFRQSLKGASTHFIHHFGLRLAIMDMTFFTTQKQRRSRRHLILQLGSLEHSVNRLISSLGQYRMHPSALPRLISSGSPLTLLGCHKPPRPSPPIGRTRIAEKLFRQPKNKP